MSWSRLRSGPRPASVDRLVAVALLAWALFDVPWWWRPPGHAGPASVIAGIAALAVAQSVPFLWRRRWPAGVLAVTAGALAVKQAAHLNAWSAGAAVLVAAYGLGAYGRRRLRQAARIGAACAALAALITLQAGRGDHAGAVACAMLGVALALGEVTSSHRDAATAAARHALDLERASLAREIHDVVAHQLSAIAVQAGAARLASAHSPDAAVAAVAVIEQEARGGLTELNSLVRSLHSAGSRGSLAAEPPRLAGLPELVRRAGKAGLRAAELTVDGRPRPLPSGVELAGYRIVQESLTNALRYAPEASAAVRLAYRGDGITIEVTDDGGGPAVRPGLPAPPAAPGAGTGLAGLAERTRLLGGSLEAGARPCGGFAVHAFLPDAP